MAILHAYAGGGNGETASTALFETRISRFSTCRNVQNPDHVTIRDFLNEIRSDGLAELISQIRNEPDKDKRNKLKSGLPAVTISGVCEKGRGGSNSVTDPSGLLQLDFDEVDNLDESIAALKSDPHVFAIFKSPSGNGIKGIAAVEKDDHAGCFRTAKKHYEQQGLELDAATKDLGRLCYLSHDPDVWISDKAPVPFEPTPEETVEPPAPEQYKVSAASEDLIEEELVDADLPSRVFGEAFIMNGKTPSGLNTLFFAKLFSAETLIKFDPKLDRFYRYESSNGLWLATTKARVRSLVRDHAVRFLADNKQTRLAHKANPNFQNAVILQLMGDCESDFTHPKGGDFVHLANCMLDLSGDEFIPRPFYSEYLSRNQIPIDFDPEAICPRFESELLGKALNSDDVRTVRLYFGQCLLGRNPTQTFLVLTGTAGGGKTQLLRVIKLVIGGQNTYELRMDHITKQFEAFNWVDKILLFAADVKGQFLQSRGAETIKKLVGGDPLNAERKGGHEHIEIAGEFNLIVTSNSRLKVKLDGDASAWRRRLLMVHYDRPPPEERIPDFAGLLVREEGSGILNFALRGLAELRGCLDSDGRFPRSDRQTESIDRLLDESDSVRAYVREGLWKKAGCTISVDDVVNEYLKFCEKKGWDGVTEKQVKDQLKDLIFEFHSEVQQRSPSPRHWKNLAVAS